MADVDVLVIVPAYDCMAYLPQCLDSLACQDYPRLRVAVVDDCSPDASGQWAYIRKRVANECMAGEVWTSVRTKANGGELASILAGTAFSVIDEPNPNDLVIAHVCGDDWLPRADTITTLASYYTDPDVWMTYGQYEIHPGKLAGHCRPYPPECHATGNYRRYGWYSSHLRSYRYGLWRHVPPEHLIDPATGEVFYYATDRAMMYPLLELARERARFIPDVLYCYRRHAGNVPSSVDSGHAGRVAAMAPVARLHAL